MSEYVCIKSSVELKLFESSIGKRTVPTGTWFAKLNLVTAELCEICEQANARKVGFWTVKQASFEFSSRLSEAILEQWSGNEIFFSLQTKAGAFRTSTPIPFRFPFPAGVGRSSCGRGSLPLTFGLRCGWKSIRLWVGYLWKAREAHCLTQ